jgi:hypothetical protein
MCPNFLGHVERPDATRLRLSALVRADSRTQKPQPSGQRKPTNMSSATYLHPKFGQQMRRRGHNTQFFLKEGYIVLNF